MTLSCGHLISKFFTRTIFWKFTHSYFLKIFFRNKVFNFVSGCSIRQQSFPAHEPHLRAIDRCCFFSLPHWPQTLLMQKNSSLLINLVKIEWIPLTKIIWNIFTFLVKLEWHQLAGFHFTAGPAQQAINKTCEVGVTFVDESKYYLARAATSEQSGLRDYQSRYQSPTVT